MQSDSLFWFFSSSAQAIATLVAFLIAGLALVQAMMDNVQQRDDSLVDIHSYLQILHYRTFRVLAIGTGCAVGFSLAMLLVSATSSPIKIYGAVFVGLINLFVIACAIWFVLIIINPQKYQLNAQKMLEDDRKQQNLPEPLATDQEFFAEFVTLESSIRNLLKKKRSYLPNEDELRPALSFRQMIDILQRHELILQPLYDELQQINRYRNLVFHGHVHETDKNMVDRTKLAINQILEITPKRSTSKRAKSRRKPAPADGRDAPA